MEEKRKPARHGSGHAGLSDEDLLQRKNEARIVRFFLA
ncbi:hypothetical protein BRI6_2112 [plant metagenome]|uniref:Uncharacterized protein n=1 Tax=plant metagenome TaxID=1297885 RepID=A0A484RDX5_9ZZZZ